MVGGTKVAKVVEEIQKLAQAPRPTALLLVGETGVGKEIAARVLFETIAARLLSALARGENAAHRPVVLGPHFVALNCAALTETLSASELFGVGADVGTGVAARRGPFLEAGEGVVSRVAYWCFGGGGVDPSYITTLIPLLAVPLLSLWRPDGDGAARDAFYQRLRVAR